MLSCRSLFNELASVACAVIGAHVGGKIAAAVASSLLTAAGAPVALGGLALVAVAGGLYYGARIGYQGAKAVLADGSPRNAHPPQRHRPASALRR